MESKADSYLAEEGKLTLNEARSLGKRDQLMMPTLVKEQAPVPPPCYQRAQARLGPALHIDALTLIMRLHLLTLCRLAVRLAHRRCSPPLRGTVQVELRAPTLRRVCCSSVSCGP